MKLTTLVLARACGLLVLLAGPAVATESLTQLSYEEFLHMDLSDKLAYTKGVFDGLVAAAALRMVPREAVAEFMTCPQNLSYGEVIAYAESYMWKTAASSERDNAKKVPAAVWIERSYRAKCAGD